MTFEILTKTYYGNTIWLWLAALILIFLALIAGKILYWLSKNVVQKLTAKTITKLDDIIVDMTEEPVVFVGVLIAIWYSLRILTLPEIVDIWIGKIFYILIIFNIAWLISRTVDALVEHYIVPLTEKTESDLDDIILPLARNAFRSIVWILAIVVGLNNAGYDIGAIVAGLGIGGLAIAMAAKDMLANVLGGVTIMTSKPFSVGDRIIVKGYDAIVNDIGLRSSKLIEFSSRRPITIPNSAFSDEPIINVSSEEKGRWVIREFRLSINTSSELMEKAIVLVREVISNHKNTYYEYAFFDNNNDFSFGLQFKYCVMNSSILEQTINEIHTAIRRKFEENKIEFSQHGSLDITNKPKIINS